MNFQKAYTSIFFSCFFFFAIYVDAQNDLNLSFPQIDSLRKAYNKEKKYPELLPYLEYAIQKCADEIGTEDSVYVEYTTKLAYTYKKKGDFRKSEELYSQDLKDRAKIFGKGHAQHLRGLHNLALFYIHTDQLENAEQLYLEGLQITVETKGTISSQYSAILNNLAHVYNKMARHQEAITLYLESKEIIKTLKGEQTKQYASRLSNLAVAYIKLKKYTEAQSLCLESKAIWEKLNLRSHPDYSLTLNNLAAIYKRFGQYEKAEQIFLEAIDIFKNKKDTIHSNYATFLNNIGGLYKSMKRYDKAETYYLESMKIRQKLLGKESANYALALHNFATVYTEIGKTSEALELHLQALKIFQKSRGHYHTRSINSWNSVAGTLSKMQQIDSAIAYYMTSLAYNVLDFDAILPDVFTVPNSSLDSKYIPKNCTINFETFDFSKLSDVDFRSPSLAMRSLVGLNNIAKKLYKSQQKTQYQQQQYTINKTIINGNQNIYSSFSEDRNKLRRLRSNKKAVGRALDLAVQIHNQEYINEGFSFAEQNKSMLLLNAVKGSRAKTLGNLPDSLYQKENKLKKKKDELKKKRINASPEQKAHFIAQENELNIAIEAFMDKLKKDYPSYYALKHRHKTTAVKAIQKLLTPQSIWLQYFITDSLTYLYVVDKESVELYPISVSKEKLENQIDNFYTNLSDYKKLVSDQSSFQNYAHNAYWFYENLVAPAIKGKEVQKLIIVPDGVLSYLPFEAFLSKLPDSEDESFQNLAYLLNKYSISYNYSASIWKENLEARKTKASGKDMGQLLAIAAAYNVNDSLLKQRTPYVKSIRKSLIDLPAAQGEVEFLSKKYVGNFIYADSANEAFFKQEAPNYNIIHLAMHGLLDEYSPILSSLAFTENGDSLEDNLLQSYEIAHLQLNAQLVVLSACETGYGKYEDGEGVLSLGRSFMYAGVPSLVVSLWQVNDASTAQIMAFFYSNLEKGMEMDEALRKAKTQYLSQHNGLLAHPAFWSPFIHLGDRSAIILKTKTHRTFYIIIGLLGLLVLILGIGWKKKRES